MKNIGIVGLGWLGLPLAQHLISKGFSVIGTCTSDEKAAHLRQAEKVNTHALHLNPKCSVDHLSFLENTEVLIINIPPQVQKQGTDFHVEQIKFLMNNLPSTQLRQVIYISSTSVYPDSIHLATEDLGFNKLSATNTTLWQAEQLILSKSDFKPIVLRLGGLLGYNRIPGMYVAGKLNVAGTPIVNYIHRDDAIHLIEFCIKNSTLPSGIYNGVAPINRTRKEVYEHNRNQFDLAPIHYLAPTGEPFKIVLSEKIVNAGFQFKFPDPLQFYYE